MAETRHVVVFNVSKIVAALQQVFNCSDEAVYDSLSEELNRFDEERSMLCIPEEFSYQKNTHQMHRFLESCNITQKKLQVHYSLIQEIYFQNLRKLMKKFILVRQNRSNSLGAH